MLHNEGNGMRRARTTQRQQPPHASEQRDHRYPPCSSFQAALRGVRSRSPSHETCGSIRHIRLRLVHSPDSQVWRQQDTDVHTRLHEEKRLQARQQTEHHTPQSKETVGILCARHSVRLAPMPYTPARPLLGPTSASEDPEKAPCRTPDCTTQEGHAPHRHSLGSAKHDLHDEKRCAAWLYLPTASQARRAGTTSPGKPQTSERRDQRYPPRPSFMRLPL